VFITPDNSYQYPLIPAHVPFVHVSVAAFHSNTIVPVFSYVPVNGVIVVTCEGASLSIQETVAVLLHVLPAKSENVNVELQFIVKIFAIAFNPLIFVSLNQVIVPITSLFVHPAISAGLYITVAVGLIVSTVNVHSSLNVPVSPTLSIA
jgi:hypothetical protein